MRRWISPREGKRTSHKTEKNVCEERKGRRERDEEREARSLALRAVCVYAQRAIERERRAGLKRARPQAHILRALHFKKHEATSKSSESAPESASAYSKK